jgi:hypothetical protein
LARYVDIATPMMNRLDTIATRQRRSRTRDLVFVAFVALAAIVSATTVGTAARASAPIASIR